MNDYLYEVARGLLDSITVSAKSDLAAARIFIEMNLRAMDQDVCVSRLSFWVSQANLVAWIGPRARTD